MRLIDRLRVDPVVRQLRRGPVLAVPAGVSAHAVEVCARRWAPRPVRESDSVLALGPAVRLLGPIARTGKRWRAAGVPADAATCYVAVVPPRLSGRDHGRRDLILGLHRRLGGWCHLDRDEEWRDTSTYLVPQSLSVWAKMALAPDDVLRLFADHVPGLRQTEFDPDFVELESAALKVQVIRNAPEDIDPYPWMQAQPWHDPAEPVTEYALYTGDDTGPGERRSIEHALRALATATGGVILDDEGFPWPDGQ